MIETGQRVPDSVLRHRLDDLWPRGDGDRIRPVILHALHVGEEVQLVLDDRPADVAGVLHRLRVRLVLSGLFSEEVLLRQ